MVAITVTVAVVVAVARRWIILSVGRCECAAEMNLMAIVPVAGGDTEIRIFRCPECSHELGLTAWRKESAA
jgi:hypothetical protein